MQVSLRPARREDAPDLARLVDMAGEGLPSYFWARMAEPGETPMEVGVRRAAGDAGGFSWRNAVVAEVAGQVAGALVSYRVADEPEPLDALPPVFRPLQALENLVPGSQLCERDRDLSRLPPAGRGGAADGGGGAAGRGRAGRVEPHRRRPQPGGAAALRGLRLRGDRRGSRWSGRAGGASSEAWVLMVRRVRASNAGRARYIDGWRVLAFP